MVLSREMPNMQISTGMEKLDKEDIGIIGNAQPTWSFGFNNTFTIYDFRLEHLLAGSSG